MNKIGSQVSHKKHLLQHSIRYFTMLFLLAVLFVFLKSPYANHLATKELKNNLLRNYDKSIRPAKDSNPILVNVSYFFDFLEEIEESRGTAKLGFYIRQEWTDPLLTWNSSSYNGIKQIKLLLSEIWTPDIRLESLDINEI